MDIRRRTAAALLALLVSHQSGLPRLAPNWNAWAGFDPANPYAGYTSELAEAGLRAASRSEQKPYSNFGFQVLGFALERASGSPFGELAQRYVFGPAVMRTAVVTPAAAGLAAGRADGRDAPAWGFTVPGPGGAQGRINDLANYAAAMLRRSRGLVPLAARVTPVRATMSDGPVGYAWITTGGITWHNGGSYGYSSVIALDLRSGKAAGYLVSTGSFNQEAVVFDFLRSL